MSFPSSGPLEPSSAGKNHFKNDFKSKSFAEKDQNQNHKDIMQHNIYSDIMPLYNVQNVYGYSLFSNMF